MEVFVPYLLKSAGITSLFLATYWLFLRKETFFEANRVFLLVGIIASACVPFVNVTNEIALTATEWADPGVMTRDGDSVDSVAHSPIVDRLQIIAYAYITIASFLFAKTLLQFASLYHMMQKGVKKHIEGINLISINDQTPPFSIFSNIVYNPALHSEAALRQILDHEAVHCKQMHSVDVILAELLLIIQWFNPLVWSYKRMLQENLEFIADKGALSQNHSKKEYQYTMLRVSQQSAYASITTNFYNSLIKKRIAMINQNHSSKQSLLKMLLILPALALFLVSFNTEDVYVPNNEGTLISSVSITDQGPIEVTIDKNTSEAELDKIAEELKEEGIDLSYSGLKYNSKNEITRITVRLSVEKGGNKSVSRSSFKNDDDEPIDPITIMHDPETNTTSMTDGSNRSRVRQGGHGPKAHIIKIENRDGGDKDIEIIHEDGKAKIMLNGEEISKEELREYRINMIKARGGKRMTIEEIEEEHEGEEKHETIIIEKIDEDEDGEGKTVRKRIKIHTDHEMHEDQDGHHIKITGNMQDALVFINGEKVDRDEMKDLPSNQIATIQVLKGEKAIEEYGEEAKDGVILITTKDNE